MRVFAPEHRRRLAHLIQPKRLATLIRRLAALGLLGTHAEISMAIKAHAPGLRAALGIKFHARAKTTPINRLANLRTTPMAGHALGTPQLAQVNPMRGLAMVFRAAHGARHVQARRMNSLALETAALGTFLAAQTSPMSHHVLASRLAHGMALHAQVNTIRHAPVILARGIFAPEPMPTEIARGHTASAAKGPRLARTFRHLHHAPPKRAALGRWE